jgi:hypothetical protein
MSIVLLGSTSGSITLQEPAVAGTNTLNLPAATGTVVVGSSAVSAAGQIPFSTDGTTYTPTAKIVSGTAVVSTSGTSIDFTSIPSWVKRITVMFDGVSTNGSSSLLVQLGTSSGIESTGYISYSNQTGNSISSAGVTSTAGLIISLTNNANIIYGNMTITKLTGNQYTEGVNMGLNAGANFALQGGGSKTLSGVLDRVRITSGNGTDTFDAGSINILYE